MNTVDILVLAVVLLNGIIGAVRGFTWQIFRIASVILAFVVARRFGSDAQALAQKWFSPGDGGLTSIICFGALFVLVYIVMSLLGHLARKFIDDLKLTSADRSLGFALGGVKGAFFVTLAFQGILLFSTFLPSDLQDQFLGNEEKGIPPSKAFELHHRVVKDRLEAMVSPELRDEMVKRAKDLGTGR